MGGGREGNLPAALHHQDGGLVVLSADPVEQPPQVQILVLAELQAVVDELETQHGPVREGEEVRRLPHLLPLLSGEGGQPGPQPLLHAGGVLSVYEEGPGEPAQDVVQGALALAQAFQAGVAGVDPVGGQRDGQLAPLTGSVVAVVQMPDRRMSLERDGERIMVELDPSAGVLPRVFLLLYKLLFAQISLLHRNNNSECM